MASSDNTIITSTTPPVSNVSNAPDSHYGERRQAVSVSGNSVPQDAAAATTEVDVEQLTAAIHSITEFLDKFDRKLEFKLDSTTGHTIITVLDAETDEIVRQIPAKEVVAMAHYLAEASPDVVLGLLVDSQA